MSPPNGLISISRRTSLTASRSRFLNFRRCFSARRSNSTWKLCTFLGFYVRKDFTQRAKLGVLSCLFEVSSVRTFLVLLIRDTGHRPPRQMLGPCKLHKYEFL